MSWNEGGVFYVMQLVPDVRPERLKFGWARSAEARWRQHLVAAPTIKILASWACSRAWEQFVTASITDSDCVQISSETFDCPDVGLILRRAEELLTSEDVSVGTYPPPGKRKVYSGWRQEERPEVPFRGLEALRRERKINRTTLAKMLGLQSWLIESMENGHVCPGPNTIAKLAHFFGVPGCDLVNAPPPP